MFSRSLQCRGAAVPVTAGENKQFLSPDSQSVAEGVRRVEPSAVLGEGVCKKTPDPTAGGRDAAPSEESTMSAHVGSCRVQRICDR